jgi:hypothetical protein
MDSALLLRSAIAFCPGLLWAPSSTFLSYIIIPLSRPLRNRPSLR